MRAQDIVQAVRILRWMPDAPNTFRTSDLAVGLGVHPRQAYRYMHAIVVAGVVEVVAEGKGAEPSLYRRACR